MVPPEIWKSEVCAGLDPKLVARVLADRNMLERAPDGLLKVHRIGGRSVRCYTITARIFAGLDATEGVTHVTCVTSGVSEGSVTGKKYNNINAVTPVTPVTPLKRMGDVSQDDPVEQPVDDLDIPGFLDRRPQTEFRPGTLCTEDDIAFMESGEFK
jgi:hypothetical protein